MKKILFMVAMAAMFTSCNKNEEEGFWKPDELFPIQGVNKPQVVADNGRGVMKMANGQQRMTAKEVTKRYLEIYTDVVWRFKNESGSEGSHFLIPEENVDTVNARFMMSLGLIIWEDGSIGKDFIYNRDNYFMDCQTRDTIAYIPNSKIESARARIIELHAEGRYEDIYELCQTAFEFYPCTGAEYKELVKRGEQ